MHSTSFDYFFIASTVQHYQVNKRQLNLINLEKTPKLFCHCNWKCSVYLGKKEAGWNAPGGKQMYILVETKIKLTAAGEEAA